MSKASPGTSREQLSPDEPEPSTSEQPSLSRDETFEMLSNRRRRYIIHYLQDEDAAATLSDLSEQVAAWENDIDIAALSASERKTVYTSLQQFHLPKMDETGAVEFDQRAGEVELTDAAEELDLYLEVVDRYDIPWSFYYIAFSAVGAILVTFSWLHIGPFGTVPYAGWTVFLLVSLFVSALSHYVLTRRMRLGAGETPPEVDDA